MTKIKIKNFSKFKDNFELPHLLDIQTHAYETFLQRNISPEKRKDHGLHEVFSEVFPLESYDGQIKLEYIDYSLGKEKYSSNEWRTIFDSISESVCTIDPEGTILDSAGQPVPLTLPSDGKGRLHEIMRMVS